jgi:RNA polymerase sigma factor (sigma-70 family)
MVRPNRLLDRIELNHMALLPPQNFQPSASTVLASLKKGDTESRNDFVWLHQEKIYAIAFMATSNHEQATQITIQSFRSAFDSLKRLNPKQVNMPVWDWLVQFAIDACADYHKRMSGVPTNHPKTDPSADGSAQMDWETTIILGVQRVKRCLTALPQEQQKVFLLRHNFQLNYDQIAAVLNQTPESVMAWLFRARVQIVKCLGRG